MQGRTRLTIAAIFFAVLWAGAAQAAPAGCAAATAAAASTLADDGTVFGQDSPVVALTSGPATCVQ